jgi:hypothetical protein
VGAGLVWVWKLQRFVEEWASSRVGARALQGSRCVCVRVLEAVGCNCHNISELPAKRDPSKKVWRGDQGKRASMAPLQCRV